MSLLHLSQIEALLFVSGAPLTKERMRKILGLSREEVTKALLALKKHLAMDEASGLTLIEDGQAVELVTKAEHGPLIESLTKSTLQENLSRPALEVLAIVAYRAPVTRSHIEAIRGVNCSFTLRNLLLRGLIERFDNPLDGREYVYKPSFAFLEKLGMGSVQDLPDFTVLSQDKRLDVVLERTNDSNQSTLP